MPIRIEHGPNLAPIGQLAYRTGQLEYRNKRRTELERLAMQQAEMRQRAQMQQQQIASSLQGQKMSQMGAMQRLAMGQQFGQINAQQAQQEAAKVAIQAQENKMLWYKQLGQNQLDLANLNAGLGDQRAIQHIQNNHRQEQAFQNLNPAGEAQWLDIGKQIVAAGLDQKIPPQELPGYIAQLKQKQDALEDQDEFTYGKKNKVGYEAADMWDEDGQATRIRFVPGVDSTGTPIVKYKLPTSKFITGPDGNQLETPLTPQEIADQGNNSVTINGYILPTEFDTDLGFFKQVPNATGEMTPERRAEEAERDRAEEKEKRDIAKEEALEKRRNDWYIAREKDRQDMVVERDARVEDRGIAGDPVLWHEAYPFPERPQPIEPAVEPPPPVAPVAPVLDFQGSSVPGIAYPGWEPQAPRDAPAAPGPEASADNQGGDSIMSSWKTNPLGFRNWDRLGKFAAQYLPENAPPAAPPAEPAVIPQAAPAPVDPAMPEWDLNAPKGSRVNPFLDPDETPPGKWYHEPGMPPMVKA